MQDDLILVTGGAGFIGSALVRYLIRETQACVLNVDALTYAANLANLAEVENNRRYAFKQIDICSAPEIERLFESYRPGAVVHLAAETHVDRGTATLLLAACRYWRALAPAQQARFRFLHVSSDAAEEREPRPCRNFYPRPVGPRFS